MYCKNCGQPMDDNSTFCPNCGQPVSQSNNYNGTQYGESNTIAVIGFVFSFLIAIVGLICSIIGLNKSKMLGGKGRGLAIAGIIISIISMVLMFILEMALMSMMEEGGTTIAFLML